MRLTKSTQRREFTNLRAVLLADIALRLKIQVEKKQQVLAQEKK